MNIRNRIRSKLLSVLSSERLRRAKRGLAEFRRRLGGRAHVIEVFLQIDDPYSYLLAHYLPALEECYDVKLVVHLSQALGDAYQPAPEKARPIDCVIAKTSHMLSMISVWSLSALST